MSRLRSSALALFLALTGCGTPSHLVFYQSSVVGADVAADTASGRINVALGYERQTNAIIPKTNTLATRRGRLRGGEAPREENEAMAVLSASKVKIRWFGAQEVNEQFATGEAAVNIATDPEAVATLATLSEIEREDAR